MITVPWLEVASVFVDPKGRPEVTVVTSVACPLVIFQNKKKVKDADRVDHWRLLSTVGYVHMYLAVPQPF